MRKQKITTQHCGLSSVKTNIGHLETAAGIAGILKVLQAIKHKKIPASLHFQELNPYISLDDSPFYIVDKSSDWDTIKDEQGNPYPRRAGISSFGFGGSNAHIVLEEFTGTTTSCSETTETPVLFVLSAKNQERLINYAQDMAIHFSRETCDLTAVTYTSQIGRDSMDARLGVLVSSMTELTEKLTLFADGEKEIPGLFTGTLAASGRNRKSDVTEVSAQEINSYLDECDIEALARLWVAGTAISWEKMYSQGIPQRVNLPTYPFARERYWFNTEPAIELSGEILKSDVIHPLVHQNTSSLSHQSYRSRFRGDEKILAEHQVDGQSVFPAMAYLEMLRVAFFDAMKMSVDEKTFVVQKLQWFDLSGVGSNLDIEIVLGEGDQDVVHLWIYAIESGQQKLMCQCEAYTTQKGVSAERSEFPQSLVDELSRRSVDSEAGFYDRASHTTLSYGPCYQCIDDTVVTENTVVARLTTDNQSECADSRYGLNPFLLESVTQIVNNIFESPARPLSLVQLPVSVEVANIVSSTTAEMYLEVVRENRSGEIAIDATFSANLFNSNGELCLRLSNLMYSSNLNSSVMDETLLTMGNLTAAAPTPPATITPAMTQEKDADSQIEIEQLLNDFY